MSYLQKVFLGQVPLLDPIVSGPAEEVVALNGERFDAVVMRRLKIVSGTHSAQSAFGYIEHLKQQKANSEVCNFSYKQEPTCAQSGIHGDSHVGIQRDFFLVFILGMFC